MRDYESTDEASARHLAADDAEPDYDVPTRAEAEAEESVWYGRMWETMSAADEEAAAADDAAQRAGLRAHLNRVHGVETQDIDDIALDAVHDEVHGRTRSS